MTKLIPKIQKCSLYSRSASPQFTEAHNTLGLLILPFLFILLPTSRVSFVNFVFRELYMCPTLVPCYPPSPPRRPTVFLQRMQMKRDPRGRSGNRDHSRRLESVLWVEGSSLQPHTDHTYQTQSWCPPIPVRTKKSRTVKPGSVSSPQCA